jgi:hypothetical protein
MNTIKQLAVAAVALLSLPATGNAQDDFEGKLQVDFVSHYMWRGQDRGGISIQPMAELNWKGLSLGLNGNTGIDKEDEQEIDLTLGYKRWGFNIGVTDYWQTGMDLKGRNLYFSYDPAKDAHQLEANIGYTHKYFSVQAYTIVWGNDFKYNTVEDWKERTNGDRAFSTYIELNVPVYFAGLDWDFTAGVTPFESAYDLEEYQDQYGSTRYKKVHSYADGPTCVMGSVRATKNFEFGDMKVPIFAELHTNPYLQTANFLFGVRIIPFK